MPWFTNVILVPRGSGGNLWHERDKRRSLGITQYRTSSMEQSEFSYLKRNNNFVQTLLMSSKGQVIVKRYKDSVLYPSVRSCVKPTVYPLDSETGWTGEVWSKTNMLK